MDAKANYPENRKPTWQCGSKLGTSEELRGELLRGDKHIASGANYPENRKPTWK